MPKTTNDQTSGSPVEEESIQLRSRIKEFRYFDPKEIKCHPMNYRLHDERQKSAMQNVLETIGFAGAVILYKSERYGGLTLIDGELRKNLAEQKIPGLLLDVTDEEAEVLLASYDPIASLAGEDKDAYQQLAAAIDTTGLEDLMKILRLDHDQTLKKNGIDPSRDSDQYATYPLVPTLDEAYDYVVILISRERDWNWLQENLKIKRKRDNKRIGVGKVLTIKELKERWASR